MIHIPTHRKPTHPGEMLVEKFLSPMQITQRELANAIHVPYQRVNELVNQKRGVTPSTALRLGKFFGVSADFWLNLQIRWDLYKAQQTEAYYRLGTLFYGQEDYLAAKLYYKMLSYKFEMHEASDEYHNDDPKGKQNTISKLKYDQDED